jgi:exodeoxyribonuclease V alpha subunit
MIIRFAHQINKGQVPKIESPFYKPELWKNKVGCLFIDADEATQEQLQFLGRAKAAIKHVVTTGEEEIVHHGMTGLDMVLRLYTKTIPEYFGKDIEIQILSPQVRGSLGTLNLNQWIQQAVNPEHQGKKQIKLGERIYREGDRVIQTRNNYDLGVFNGDIRRIRQIDLGNYF